VSIVTGFKVFASDLSAPIQGGAPVWDGHTPYQLPEVVVDRGDDECAPGWNFCRDLPTALRIAGLWPRGGRPSRVFTVQAAAPLQRGDKLRAPTLTIVRELPDAEIEDGIRVLSKAFTPHEEWMAAEQIAWRRALARPCLDAARIAIALREALDVRGLTWGLRRFDSERAAWAAWDARDARDARAAWAAWAARDAWAALTLGFASRQGWVQADAMLLTYGLRDAYQHGLGVALPTGPDELGWSAS